jgi:PKD repeat protein
MKVMLIAASANGACPDTAMQDIVVGLVPVCDFEIENTYLPGHRAYHFVPQHKGASYTWFFGDGNTSTAEAPVYQYRRDGQFPVRVIVTTAEGCQCEASTQHVVYNLSVSNTNNNESVFVYPNPSSGILYLESAKNTALRNVEVLNAVGATVYAKSLDSNAQLQEMDLSHVAAGVYTVKIETVNAETIVHRIIIAN